GAAGCTLSRRRGFAPPRPGDAAPAGTTGTGNYGRRRPRLSIWPPLARRCRQTDIPIRKDSSPMQPTITAFESSPDRGRGLARDMRVRWALEETGQPYDVRLLSFKAMKQRAHMALHPFGQIPTWEEDGLVLFESGAIVLHLAERHPSLLPDDTNARARAIAWMFAALNTMEPPIAEYTTTLLFERDKPWHAERLH